MAEQTLLQNMRSDLVYCPEQIDIEKIGWRKADILFNRNWKHLVECDQKAQEKKSLVGRVFGIPIGDGAAYYQVMSEIKSKVFIQHIKGIGDDWTDRYYGNGGTFSKKEILRRLEISGFNHNKRTQNGNIA